VSSADGFIQCRHKQARPVKRCVKTGSDEREADGTQDERCT